MSVYGFLSQEQLASTPMKPLNQRLGAVTQLLDQSMGHCRRCETTYRFVLPHVTVVDDLSHVIVCQLCWEELPVEERLIYYRLLWYQQGLSLPFEQLADPGAHNRLWLRIRQAVLEGR